MLASQVLRCSAHVSVQSVVDIDKTPVIPRIKVIDMFHPTHMLVSRSQQTPVQLLPGSRGYLLQTEQEWQNGKVPAFEMNSRRGFFCRSIPVVGYSLQPIATVADRIQSETVAPKA
jgi:hypothetical protein